MLSAFLWVILVSCETAGPYPYSFDDIHEIHQIKGVPFFPQKAFQCGPAALTGVLNFYGENLTPEKIKDAVFRKSLRATTTLDMLLFPRQIGFSSRYYKGSPQDLKKSVDNAIPVIVMVDYGLGPVSRNHFMVVVGYTSDAVILNSDTRESIRLPWEKFLNQWEKTNYWTLRIDPPEYRNGNR